MRLVNLGPIALFGNFKLTTCSGKLLEDVSHAHLVSLMYKLITPNKSSDDLSIGFDRSRGRRGDELTNNKNVKGKHRFRFILKDVVGFVDCQEKPSYGLGYKLTLTRNKDVAVIDKTGGIADARIKIDHIHWYIPHYTSSVEQQNKLLKQIVNKTPTEFRYFERSVFMKEVRFRTCGISN